MSFVVLNPHGSDKTVDKTKSLKSDCKKVLNPHGSDKTRKRTNIPFPPFRVLNPHGSDKTKN